VSFWQLSGAGPGGGGSPARSSGAPTTLRRDTPASVEPEFKPPFDRGQTGGWSPTSSGYTPAPPAGSTWLEEFQDPAERAAREAQSYISDYTDNLGATSGTRQLSWEEYDALTPRQQAAIDANGALYNAILADKEAGSSGERIAGYDDSVLELFGEHGGSDTYAPRTVALIRELGLEQLPNQDLDQYLGLNALIREDDLSLLADMDRENPYAESGTPEGVSHVRLGHVNRFSDASLEAMSRVLAQGQSLLDAARASSGDAGSQLFGERGQTLTDMYSQDMETLFEKMSRREGGLTSEQLSQVLYGMEQEYQLTASQIQDYLETRLRATSYGAAAGGANTITGLASDVDYLTPEEFRQRYYTGGS